MEQGTAVGMGTRTQSRVPYPNTHVFMGQGRGGECLARRPYKVGKNILTDYAKAATGGT